MEPEFLSVMIVYRVLKDFFNLKMKSKYSKDRMRCQGVIIPEDSGTNKIGNNDVDSVVTAGNDQKSNTYCCGEPGKKMKRPPSTRGV